MRENILGWAFIFLSLISCQSPKAKALKQAVLNKERTVFRILLDKNGSETKKQECLIKNDYPCALKAVDTQNDEFNRIITDLESLKDEDTKEGDLLRNASVNYYKALKELHLFDRKEIEQQMLISQLPQDKMKDAQDELIILARQKKSLYTKVYEKEGLLSEAMKKFDDANGL